MAAENDLGRDNIKKLVIRIAVPSMLAQFVSVLYSIVDRMYIGNIPVSGDMALAGAGVCGDCKGPESMCSQLVIVRRCQFEDRIKVILVGEELGF